ncbi:hypothetical protein Clacol_009914 [Clathrus columnatus]|uniref:Uncharacterized protein n=1 Tax=Clathrus columnatus TaxID=1419009 RepID=A0AAV5ATH2_9AGAM|nr:hypothetical protein Clacol_009914 [Clathrus columnatus]
MSPVHMHYLPPLRIREPINVMTLRNCGGYRHEYSTNSCNKLKPRGQSTHPTVASLLYTFPRPTSKPKPSLSLKDLPMRRPFGLVSQNRTQPEQPTKLDDDVQDTHSIPPPSLFLDVSPSPPHPPAFPLLTNKRPSTKHIRIIQNPVVHRDGDERNPWATSKERSRIPTPAPSPKLRIPDDAPLSYPSPSLRTPTPLRRIPSLPIPIPHHKPREEDTGVFENVSLSSIGGDDNDGDDGFRAERGLRDGNTEDEHDDGDNGSCLQSNDLQLAFPTLVDDSSNPRTPSRPPLRLYPSQLLLDNGASESEHIGSRSRSSSLSPKLGLDFTFGQDRDREAGPPGFIPLSPLFPSSPRDESNQSSIRYTVGTEGDSTLASKKKMRNRDRELAKVEYFNNSTDDHNLSVPYLPAQTYEPTSNYYDLSPDSEPIFPVFSPTCGPTTSNTGFGEYAYPALDDQTNLDEFDGQDNTREDSPPNDGSTMNPWLKVTTKFNNLSLEFSERQNYKNGRANLNVFNPPALPSFVGSDSGSGSGSDHSSSSDSDTESQPFLSFPIPIFLPEDPYAVTQVDVARVPIGLGQQQGSFRSSVYGGFEDSTGKVGLQVESQFQTQSCMKPQRPIAEQISRRDTPTPPARIKSTALDIPASQTETSNRFVTPEQGQRGQGRKRENGTGDATSGTGAYVLLKKIIKRHG